LSEVPTPPKSAPDSFTRSKTDRRQNTLGSFFGQFHRGRRRGERRDDAGEPSYYVDLHEPWLLTSVVLVLVLCVMDTYNTLTILEHGGEELNPVMKVLIEYNVWVFFILKYVVTALGLIVLVMHKHFSFLKVIKTHWLVAACLIGYTILIIYEFVLLSRIE